LLELLEFPLEDKPFRGSANGWVLRFLAAQIDHGQRHGGTFQAGA
jgi:hypothetical protein